MSSIFKPVGKIVKGVGKALGLVPDAPPPIETPGMSEAMKRQEKRAKEAQEAAMRSLMARKRARRTGGMRLLMSKKRQEEAGQETVTKMGGNV